MTNGSLMKVESIAEWSTFDFAGTQYFYLFYIYIF